MDVLGSLWKKQMTLERLAELEVEVPELLAEPERGVACLGARHQQAHDAASGGRHQAEWTLLDLVHVWL